MKKCVSFCLTVSAVSFFLLIFAATTQADVKLPAIIGSNMVLQRGLPDKIWGWADPSEEVAVEIANQKKTATTSADGKWLVTLDSMRAGGPFTMTISGKNTIVCENVMVGEVWVCSGQSNMQWSVNQAYNSAGEIAAAKYPNIRLITVPRVSKTKPQDNFVGQWVPCSPETVPGFSAVGYFFGRKLYQELDGVAIGLVNSSWGGSSCEAWATVETIEKNADFAPLLARRAEAMKKEPDGGGNQMTGYLFNGMIAPITNYGIRGAIWYQGESNAGRAFQYRTLFPTMIQNWRDEWNQGDFPFYFVQLANYMAVKPEPGDSAWAELREAQTMTRQLKNTGEAVIIDLGDAKDIHPKNKQDVGDRLARLALANDYKKELIKYGPTYKSMKVEGNKITIEFDYVGGGLRQARPIYADGKYVTTVGDGGNLQGFAIAGADKKFVWADDPKLTKIEGNKVVVSSDKVPNPVAVRYAWADNPICNLYNAEGLPAAPFRTDDWPGVTVNNK